jgi:hypothetical protein
VVASRSVPSISVRVAPVIQIASSGALIRRRPLTADGGSLVHVVRKPHRADARQPVREASVEAAADGILDHRAQHGMEGADLQIAVVAYPGDADELIDISAAQRQHAVGAVEEDPQPVRAVGDPGRCAHLAVGDAESGDDRGASVVVHVA